MLSKPMAKVEEKERRLTQGCPEVRAQSPELRVQSSEVRKKQKDYEQIRSLNHEPRAC